MTEISHVWLRKPAVLEKIGCGSIKLYDLIEHQGFPKPIKMGRASLWCESEIDRWLLDQLAKRDDPERRGPGRPKKGEAAKQREIAA
jgi:predicted DNA-binding transcriptional regulator AlpA